MPPGRQLGLLWGAVALALVAAAPFAPALAGALPACPVRSLLGLPCPTCGATRAAVALAALDPRAAFAWNPLAAAGWIALIVGGVVAGGAGALGRGLPDPPRRLPTAARLAILAAVLGDWLYLVSRGV